jgi:hypothetical protein
MLDTWLALLSKYLNRTYKLKIEHIVQFQPKGPKPEKIGGVNSHPN